VVPPGPLPPPIRVIPAADVGGLTGEASPLTLGQEDDCRRVAAMWGTNGAEQAMAAAGPLAGQAWQQDS